MSLPTIFQPIRASIMGTICIILLLRGTDTKMDGFEEDPNPRKNMIFLNSEDNFSNRMSTKDVMFITVLFPSATEKTLTTSSPRRNSCTEIPPKKNDSIDYPGRSVLYSRKFLPLNRIIDTDFKILPSEPEPSDNYRADEEKGKED
jgi:hypothetical protein